MPVSRSRSAFTLIELLIVVGIIAILAAIAIPNMLEAQVRAKVARAKSDMRTITTGLESYRVDNNHYPTYHYTANSRVVQGFSFHPGGTITGVNQSPPFDGRNPLTTPISYLTSFPRDPFGVRAEGDSLEGDQFWYVNWDYALSITDRTDFQQLRALQGPWRLHSNGPDMTGPDSGGSGTLLHTPYDPTNGTISVGDIIRGQRQGQV